MFLIQNSPDLWNNIPLARYWSSIPKILCLLCVFAQNVPCKFAIAWGFQNNTCKESSDNCFFKQPNGFMSSLPHEMSINSFPSFVFGLACVAGVKRGRGRGNLGMRGRKERNLFLHRAQSCALILFPYPPLSLSNACHAGYLWPKMMRIQNSTKVKVGQIGIMKASMKGFYRNNDLLTTCQCLQL